MKDATTAKKRSESTKAVAGGAISKPKALAA
jgi:hypothetical protein